MKLLHMINIIAIGEAFLQKVQVICFYNHMIETTVQNSGKVGVVVPHGVLFRSGAEGKIRQQFIEENLLEAVIGLPAKLFFGTGIPVAILIFNRGKKTKDVFLLMQAKNTRKVKIKTN